MSTTSQDLPDTTGANKLLDCVRERMGVKNDAALCRALAVAPAVISKIRHGKLQVTSRMMIRMHFRSGLSIAEIFALLGLDAK